MKNNFKVFGCTVGLLALAILATTASAQPGGPGKGGPGKGGPGKGGQARGKNGFGQAGQRGGPGGAEAMVQRMIQMFDTNGDQALDAKELLALFTQMQQGGAGGRGRTCRGRRRWNWSH